jgi:hypothetical protein
MTWAEYQDCYREALILLNEQGLIEGKPSIDPHGLRSCPVSGEALGDLEVLRRAFGDTVALKILGERITDLD